MIIHNTSTNSAQPFVRPVSDDAPKVAVDAVKQAPAHEPSSQQLQAAVASMNRVMQISNQNLKFSLDPSTKEPVVQVVDTETGDLIRQIPSKEALAVAESIDQFLQRGVLLKQKA